MRGHETMKGFVKLVISIDRRKIEITNCSYDMSLLTNDKSANQDVKKRKKITRFWQSASIWHF